MDRTWTKRKQKQDQFLELVRASGGKRSRADVMRGIGYKPTTYKYWCKADPDFKAKVDRAYRTTGGLPPPDPGDFVSFRERYLNVGETNVHNGKILMRGVTYPFQEPFCRAVADPTIQKVMALLPVRSGKTTIIEQLVVWYLCRRPQARIILVGRSQKHAKERAYAIQQMLLDAELYPALHDEWGAWIGKSEGRTRPWSLTGFYIKGRKDAERSPSVSCYGIGTDTYGARADLIILDDVDSPSLGDGERDSIMLAIQGPISTRLAEGGKLIMIGCLTADTPVLMADGTWRPIAAVKPGEFVVSRGPDSFEEREVEAMIPQGEAEIVEVRTTRRVVRSTPSHPFLVGGAWKRADALVPGDRIEALDQWDGNCTPEWATAGLVWLLGFFLGDGWTGRGETAWSCIALSSDEALNERVRELAEEWLGRFYRTPFGYIRCDQRRAHEGLVDAGLGGGAKTKRIPSWVYQSSAEVRLAFLRGLFEADGSRMKPQHDHWRIELANKELIEDVQRLAWTLGLPTGKILVRSRLCQPPNSPKPIEATAWSTAVNFGNKKPKREVVVSVEPAGRAEVYDLTVEGTHNFLANGLVVHNTRCGTSDVYSRLQYQAGWWVDVQQGLIEEEDGTLRSVCEEMRPLDELLAFRDDNNELFQMLVQNDPVAALGMMFPPDLVNTSKGAFGVGDAPEDWERLVSIDPATSGRAACLSLAVSPDHRNIRVIDCDVRVNPRHDGLFSMLRAAVIAHHPRRVVIEAQGGSHLFAEVPEVKEFIYDEGARLIEYRTGTEKHDSIAGIPIVATMMTQGRLQVAWGDEEARSRLRPLERDMLGYRPEAKTKKRRFDALEALWFGVTTVRADFRAKGRYPRVADPLVSSRPWMQRKQPERRALWPTWPAIS